MAYPKRLAEATVIQVFPHLGRGYCKGLVVPIWPEGDKFRVCTTGGKYDVLLTREQAEVSLKTRRTPDGSIIRFCEPESKRIIDNLLSELRK